MADIYRPYKIQYLGLKEGLHHFNFELGPEFFDSFEYSELANASYTAAATLHRKSTMIEIDFVIEGKGTYACDRCNDPMDIEMGDEFKLIVKFGDEFNNEQEEILVLGPADFEIDLTQYLYEFCHLCIPSKTAHDDENDCNPAVIEKLDELNAPDDNDDDEIDPRWSALKGIK